MQDTHFLFLTFPCHIYISLLGWWDRQLGRRVRLPLFTLLPLVASASCSNTFLLSLPKPQIPYCWINKLLSELLNLSQELSQWQREPNPTLSSQARKPLEHLPGASDFLPSALGTSQARAPLAFPSPSQTRPPSPLPGISPSLLSPITSPESWHHPRHTPGPFRQPLGRRTPGGPAPRKADPPLGNPGQAYDGPSEVAAGEALQDPHTTPGPRQRGP